MEKLWSRGASEAFQHMKILSDVPMEFPLLAPLYFPVEPPVSLSRQLEVLAEYLSYGLQVDQPCLAQTIELVFPLDEVRSAKAIYTPHFPIISAG